MQAKLPRLQDPGQSSAVILNNVNVKLVGTSVKTGEYLRAKINELETTSKDKNMRDTCRGINEFKMRYQPITNPVQLRIPTSF
jgi:hypothetical protein